MRRLLSAAAVVAAAGAAAAVPAMAATKSIKVGDDFFVKKGGATVTVPKGTNVTWRWSGKAPHNVTATGAASFKSKTQTKGTFSKKVTKAGTYKVICTIHSGMKMTLKVK